MPSKQDILNLQFMEARCNLIDLAAFLDRVDRHAGDEDFRIQALRSALQVLVQEGPHRTRTVLEMLSDPSLEPVEAAETPAAFGAPRSHPDSDS
jgi:hypothetical protein